MTKIVITAQVEEVESWEEGYRKHAPMLRNFLGVTKPIHFSTNKEMNEICLCSEPDDLEKYLQLVQSPEVAEAMKKNGVKGETVRLYILDKVLEG